MGTDSGPDAAIPRGRTSLARRRFLRLAATSSPLLMTSAGLSEARERTPRGEKLSLNVCPETKENPRHDHAQLFPLDEKRLLLVWSEYYVKSPTVILRDAKTRDDAPCRISARVSSDGGRSWSGRICPQESVGGRSVKQANLVRLHSGDVLFFFTVWFGRNDRQILVKRSRDNCETWNQPKQFSKPGGFYILDAGNIIRHSSGRIVLPAYWSPEYGRKMEHYRAFCYFSDDEGENWRESETRIDVPGRGAMEPAIAERKDGSLLAILRTSLGKLYQAESADRGTNWSASKPTSLGAPQSEPSLSRIPGTGDLLLLWNNPARVRGHGPRNPLSSAVSKDGGRSWANIKAIDRRSGFDLAYPSVLFRGDEVLVTYYEHERSKGGGGHGLVLKIYDINWLYTPAS